jgi:Laminin G domain
MRTHAIRRSWTVPVTLVLSGALVVATAVTGAFSGAAATTNKQLMLDFDSMGGGGPITSAGWLPVDIGVSTANGGAVTAVPDPDGGRAARFPAWDGILPAAHAVVTVVRDGAGDELSPRYRDFRFGVSFRLFQTSEGGLLDNGNNLVQRGRFSDPGQYKLQVDHGHVSCRILGSSGAAFVRSSVAVEPGQWYTARCSRIGSEITLALVDRTDGDTTRTTVVEPTGLVDADSVSEPLSVGGKVASNGKVVIGDADQFNGVLDDVFYDAW